MVIFCAQRCNDLVLVLDLDEKLETVRQIVKEIKENTYGLLLFGLLLEQLRKISLTLGGGW